MTVHSCRHGDQFTFAPRVRLASYRTAFWAYDLAVKHPTEGHHFVPRGRDYPIRTNTQGTTSSFHPVPQKPHRPLGLEATPTRWLGKRLPTGREESSRTTSFNLESSRRPWLNDVQLEDPKPGTTVGVFCGPDSFLSCPVNRRQRGQQLLLAYGQSSVAWSSHGVFLASASVDTAVRIWTVDTVRLVSSPSLPSAVTLSDELGQQGLITKILKAIPAMCSV